MPAKKPSTRASSADEMVLHIDGHAVRCTRLTKVLYPHAGFTKAEVINYYVRAAPFLLPHFRDRPVTLKRFPDGVHAEAYWEKDAPSFTPEWVKTYPVPRRAGGPDIRYILLNDTATLAWAANAAALELHPFLHRKPKIGQPTSIVFDLDPGDGADILSCAEVAILLRGVFDGLELQAFPKVSGSKGIQLHIPLNTPATYEVTQAFALSIAQLIERQHPDLAISEMPKAKRAGKVFIDWSQNADFKTTVVVYSLRAKRDRPFVSMPVRWEELELALSDRKTGSLFFDPKQALARLEDIGDLYADVETLKQKLPPNVLKAIEQQGTGSRPESRQLKAYAAKRDFGVTEEPPASLPRRSAQGSRRRFVIQKHAASHLHYDFRLEMHDVLKSWAVPKGVPYELGVRRLASATEDHPVEYLDFEGIIPQGQYGGGTVMVWDIGTYEVIEGNYWKGYLHFALRGKKLKGEWTLRADREKGGNAWMLEKAGRAMKALSQKQEDASAVTGRSMAQIAKDRDAQWQSNRSNVDLSEFPVAKAEFIEPMQAKLSPHVPKGAGWEFEAKFDGYRALIVKDSRVRILSRRNNELSESFPVLVEGVQGLDAETVLDGEIVALDENGKPSFNLLQNRRWHEGSVQFYAFDLLVFRGRSLLNAPLARRRELLEIAVAGVQQPPILVSRALQGRPQDLAAAAKKAGLEGLVAKQKDSRYEPGKRSGAWSKVKFHLDQELVIGGYLPGPRGFDALLAGYYRGKELIFAGKIRNGFGAPGAKEAVAEKFAGLGTTKCPFDSLPEPKNARRGMALTAEAMKLCCWLKPKLVAQVGIREWTKDGHLRHSAFLGLRDDKDAREVVRE